MIELRGLTRRFGPTTALEGVSLVLPEGGRLAVVGPSGSGKTTLLRLIAGLDEPDAGEVHLAGRLASRPGWCLPPHRRGIGFVFQSGALWPHLTVEENIGFGLAGMGRAQARARVAEVIAQTALDGLARRRPAELSGGEARRVALARALAPRPRYLLLDEPLTNLDPALKAELLELIAAAAREAAGLVYVTHDRAEAEALAERTVALRAGRLLAEGSPDGELA